MTQIHPLPPALVSLLEEKHQLQGRLGLNGARTWSEFGPKLRSTLLNLAAGASHPRLEEIASELRDCLERLESNLHEPEKWRDFAADLYRLYRLLDQYGEARKELSVTRLGTVDALIHAVQAYLRGNLPPAALPHFEAAAKLAVDELLELYRNLPSDFDERARQGILMGVDSFTQAARELQTRDPEQMKNALVNLRNGARLLEHLALWRDEFESALSSPVPVVGEYVRLMQKQLRENGRLQDDILREWVKERFWDLQEHWAVVRHDLFMPRHQKDQLVERGDALMLNLRDLDTVSHPIQQQLRASLEAFYETLKTRGFELEKLRRHPTPWMADLIVAILAGGVPVFQIRETIEEFRNSLFDPYGKLLEKYLDEEDRDYLLDALALLERQCLELRDHKSETP